MSARFAAALLVALFIQFVGGEIIFRHIETEQMQRARSRYLADHLTIAGRLISQNADPETMNLLSRMWQDRLVITVLDGPPMANPPPETPELKIIRQRLLDASPGLVSDALRLSRNGNALEGTLRLENGNWISFQSGHYFGTAPIVVHYVASITLLLLCVAVIALLFGRMIGRPLRQLAEAAEKVGRDEIVSVEVGGPSEVRQVAGAFEAMQTRLLDHVREREQSLAAMSHDLRTPLARLKLNASLVQDPELRAIIENDAGEMEAFIASVLDYLRGDKTEAEQRADVASIVMTIVDEARDAGEDAEYHGPDRLEWVTRPLKLKRVVRNLVQNAGRHAGNARVTLSATGDDLVIVVEDDGPGIAPADIPSVFEPFKRLDASRNCQTGGAGLGLASARRLVIRMGGEITLGNRLEGGLRALIRLPGRHDGS